MTVTEQIKETKDNGCFIECKLLGDGTEEDHFRPEIFDTYPTTYKHLDAKDIDYVAKTVKLWVNKKKSPPAEINKIKADVKITKIKETTNGIEG